MTITEQEIWGYLRGLAEKYNALTDERDFLMNGTAARLTQVNNDRQEVVAEAQTQLDRLNAIRVADGRPALTLAQVRAAVSSFRPGARA